MTPFFKCLKVILDLGGRRSKLLKKNENRLHCINNINKKYLKKKISSCISIVEYVLGLSVLLYVTQGHPTWESKIDTVTMQTLL